MRERVFRSWKGAALASVVTMLVAAPARADPSTSLTLTPAILADQPVPVPPPTAAPGATTKPAKGAKKAKAPKAPKTRHAHKPEDGPWDTGALWVTLRAGYNRATYSTAGDGNVGWNFGATRMINTGWSLSGWSGRDVLGKFGNAAELQIPFILEVDRHLKWGGTFRPYYGFGGGAYYHKFSNTTTDHSDVRGGGFVSAGGNAVVSPHNFVGLDARFTVTSARGGKPPENAVFGPQEQSTSSFSVKLGWSVTY